MKHKAVSTPAFIYFILHSIFELLMGELLPGVSWGQMILVGVTGYVCALCGEEPGDTGVTQTFF